MSEIINVFCKIVSFYILFLHKKKLIYSLILMGIKNFLNNIYNGNAIIEENTL